MAALTPPLPPEILLGVAYYPEYHQTDRLLTDLDLMVTAGINVIRVGESVWSTWEPRDGEFNLEWLAPVLDAAHARGIRAILGTPTYAVPPWLQTAHPEIAGERRTGERIPWGGRQEVDYSHPAFRFHAERIIRKIVSRYAQHPAVIGYQVDNEPGLELLYNQGVFTGFVRSLQERYGSVENLNREWGLTYWSHRIDDWSQLWRPDGNTFPQYDLAWRRYQAQVTADFISWQAGIVREYSRDDQFVTTCLQYPRRGVDDRTVDESLDVGSGNPYYGMQDHLDASKSLAPVNDWTTTSVPGLLRQADRIYSSKQQRYLVTETNAQSIDGPSSNLPAYPGQLRQTAFTFISRGAAMIEYWHWHTLPYGAETYWGGILPHSLVPGRVYEEISRIGAQLKAIGTGLDGFVPDADVAVIWSNPSRYALQFMPPLSESGLQDDESYEHIIDAFYRGVVQAGLQARILHLEQARDSGPAELAARYPVLVAAGAYIATDEDLELLRGYAAAGGHLIMGPRTAYADQEARARVDVAPPGLAEAAGVRYEEYSNLDSPVRVTPSPALPVTGEAEASSWIDGLIPEGAEILAGYDHPRFKDFATVTTNRHGSGRISVVGTLPSPELGAAVCSLGSPRHTAPPFAPLPAPVTASSGVAGGARWWFLFNWGWDEQTLTSAAALDDAITGERLLDGDPVALAAWDTRILRCEPAEMREGQQS